MSYYKKSSKYDGVPIGSYEEYHYSKPLKPGQSYITIWGWMIFCGMLVIPFLNLLCWIPLLVCRKRVPMDIYDEPKEYRPFKLPDAE